MSHFVEIQDLARICAERSESPKVLHLWNFNESASHHMKNLNIKEFLRAIKFTISNNTLGTTFVPHTHNHINHQFINETYKKTPPDCSPIEIGCQNTNKIHKYDILL